MLIHIKRNAEEFGPYSVEEAREYLSAGRLSLSDFAQLPGTTEWIPLASVPGVKSAPPPPPPDSPNPKAQMSLHATLNQAEMLLRQAPPNEAAKVQRPDAATAFRNDFFDKYPDLLPHESVVDAVAAKLQASGYKGESREAVMETFAKAARQEIARQQQAPPISEIKMPTDAGSSKQNESTPPSRMSPWKRADKAFGIGCFVGIASVYQSNRNNPDLSSSDRMLLAGILGVVVGLVAYLVAVVYYAGKGER
jgi:HIV Tat-specific factor 1